MGAYQDFVALIRKTEVMEQVIKDLEEEPAQILGSICKEYQTTNQPVPDHHLHFPGYVGKISLQALITAGLVDSEAGGRLSLYSYKPTQKGLEQYKNLLNEGFYQK